MVREWDQSFLATESMRFQLSVQSKAYLECIHTVRKKNLYLKPKHQIGPRVGSGLCCLASSLQHTKTSLNRVQITFGCLTLTPSCSPLLVRIWLPSRYRSAQHERITIATREALFISMEEAGWSGTGNPKQRGTGSTHSQTFLESLHWRICAPEND